MNKYLIYALISLMISSPAMGDVIVPVSVDVSSTWSTYDEINLINGSGLDGANLHSESPFTDSWLADQFDVTPTLTFDLGGLFSVTSADIWNYNAICCGLDRGVQDLNILGSTNGVDFALITLATLTQSPGGLIAADNIAFASVVSHIQFQVLSNYGASDFTGLAEVRFNGQSAAAVAEPGILSLFGLGLIGLALLRRRQI